MRIEVSNKLIGHIKTNEDNTFHEPKVKEPSSCTLLAVDIIFYQLILSRS